ncbi:hypothetical protein SAMN02745135_02509 [Caloranaerobacter azorensis DSM 13643]|uniref:GIY-YIG domain-containing protein n=1 Tax=Caloranaerobacter azorensis DSM 13643 TaxID=1121264 RepID=A0A1M5WJ66_9FIRM|nr:hypothetical protein [Caloranaerobacter azorensis]SHH87600.1 hypothetical protein SAMN02745135_02509 [Caloranaerobacter azorensis DSM 13643]
MQIEYIRFVVEEVFLRNNYYKYGYISDIKEFKEIDDYANQVIEWLKNGSKKRWIGAIYKYIYEQQLDFLDYKNYEELTNQDNGVYVIADNKGDVLYIGKSDNKDFDLFSRLFDHLVPKRSEEYPNGQKKNNTPEIWNNDIKTGKNLKIFVCCNINFDPELLEIYLIARYKLKYGHTPKYNKDNAKPFSKKLLLNSIIDYTDFLMRL